MKTSINNKNSQSKDYKIIVEQFDRLVSKSAKVYLVKDPQIQEYLKTVKAKVKVKNKNLTPYIDSQYKCNTCNTKFKSHPETSYCFICDTDNWEKYTPKINNSILQTYE